MIIILTAIMVVGSSIFSFAQPIDKNKYASYLKGIYYLEEGKYFEGLKELEKVKKIDPKSIFLRLKIVYALIQLRQFRSAEAELNEIKKLDPTNPQVSFLLSLLYSYEGKEKEFENEYGEFLKIMYNKEPKDLEIAEELAQFYFYKKKYDDAIKIYQEIVKNNPTYVDGLFWLGYLYEETGKRNEAIKLWEEVLKISPDHALTLNSLGYVYAEEGINLDKAEVMVRKALEKEPQNGAYLDSLGWIYFKKKDYKMAEKYLLDANNFLKDPVIYEHLGDLYLTLEMPEKAIFYYKKGLEHFPDNIRLKEKLNTYESKDKVIKK